MPVPSLAEGSKWEELLSPPALVPGGSNDARTACGQSSLSTCRSHLEAFALFRGTFWLVITDS